MLLRIQRRKGVGGSTAWVAPNCLLTEPLLGERAPGSQHHAVGLTHSPGVWLREL